MASKKIQRCKRRLVWEILWFFIYFLHFKWNLSKCRTKTDIYRTCHWQLLTNAWQFKTELSVTEVILKLQVPEIQDTLYYDFWKRNGTYFLKINGIWGGNIWIYGEKAGLYPAIDDKKLYGKDEENAKGDDFLFCNDNNDEYSIKRNL